LYLLQKLDKISVQAIGPPSVGGLMLTEKIEYIRKSFFILFLMFLCLQGASCGQERIIIKPETSDGEISLDDQFEEITNINEDVSDSGGDTDKSAKTSKCFVYVCGSVKFPGVYQLDPSSRVYEAIDKAGGLTEEAEKSAINLAVPVEDGQMIYVPTVEEAQNGDFLPDAVANEDVEDGLVNINTAGVDELTTLSGVGKVKAESIIEYRQNNGAFKDIEDIMNVSGIGQGSFDKIKNKIKVK